MSSGYFNQFGVDLDGWFGPLGGGISTHKVGYQVAGQDLNLRYWPLSLGGIQVPPTGFYWHGQDLNTIFGWPPITAVNLEVFLIQSQPLDGAIVSTFDAQGAVTQNKYYATGGIGTLFGDNIPAGAVIQPSLPVTIVNLTGPYGIAPAMPTNAQTGTALGFRINNGDGTYSTLLEKYPTAVFTVTASTPGASAALGGDLPGLGVTVVVGAVQVLENNSGASFKIEVPSATPGNPPTLLYFASICRKPPTEIVPIANVTSAIAHVGLPLSTPASGLQDPIAATSSAIWQPGTNIIALSVNATAANRVPLPPTTDPATAAATIAVVYTGGGGSGVDYWGIDPTNLFTEETVVVNRTGSTLSGVPLWAANGPGVGVFSRGGFTGDSHSPVWVAGTTTNDSNPNLPPINGDPSDGLNGLLNRVLLCQSKLAFEGDKLDILGDYYIVDTSAMNRFVYTNSGTLQYTGS
jgi:hypothetical protein